MVLSPEPALASEVCRPDATAPSAVAQSERLNQRCFCITLDRAALNESLARETADPEFAARFGAARPHLFSNVPVFLPAAVMAEMESVVEAIEAASRLPGYLHKVLSWAPEIAQSDHGPAGAFMGYDFHLDEGGPRLIEINTNAGGAFLNAALGRAHRACCTELELSFRLSQADNFERDVVDMFREEWRRQGRTEPLRSVAIVDDRPEEQYLYPEFILAKEMLQRHGIEALIADPSQLRLAAGKLLFGTREIDLVYNRLVDFALERPEHAVLNAAYREDAVAMTPNPHIHAILADKRNLTLLSDAAELAACGLVPELRRRLRGIPKALLVTADNADALWRTRADYYFKPATGHGSKAVYRGDKLTKSVWQEITRGGYIAQALAKPSQRMIELDGTPVSRKLDVRLYTYNGRLLLAAARLYQGQTTNFRTLGGGFAPILVI